MFVERIEEVYGLYFRSVFLPEAGMRIPQHVHDHNHATYVGNGRARVYVNDRILGDYEAGQVVPVEAGKKHEFEALEPNTRLTCVHDVASAESIKWKGL